jgi:phosphoribosylanthranilate isomerase
LKGVVVKTWIKFCGTTSLADALASIEAGASALGFIFAPSKRRILPEQAQEIIRHIPPDIERIGVFLDSGEGIARTVRGVDLTGIQMHGPRDIPSEIYRRLPQDRRDLIRKIKTILVGENFAGKLEGALTSAECVDAWLLDSGAGSGQTFEWHNVQAGVRNRKGRFIIAGGLTPENVGEAVRTFQPWGVDVVSGIEREPGSKDPEKMKAFVAAVRKAEQP